MKIAILGSGNGGCAMSADWSLAGHEVRLFDFKEFPSQIEAIARKGGIDTEGELTGFAPVLYAGHDIRRAVEGAELIVAVGPAYSTEPLARELKPHLAKGQTVVVSPGSTGGGLLFKRTLGFKPEDPSVTVAETSTLPYACRLLGPGKVHIYLKLKGGLYLSALPSKAAEGVRERFASIYKCIQLGENYFQTMLQNANPVIHPAVTLLNAGRIENTNGNFLFYEEGVMPGVGRLMAAVDRERIAIGKALGVTVLPDTVIGIKQGYMTSDSYETGYSTAPGFKGIKAQSKLDHRYLNEDVGYGLVLLHEMGEALGVGTPHIDAIITLASTVTGRDYRSEAKRTLRILGLPEGEALRTARL
jgi:opine dehydrogenase